MIQIDLNCDSPHSPERTAHTADVWVDCMRVLISAMDRGLEYPADLYRVIGDISEGADHLASMLRKAEEWMNRQHDAGSLVVAGDPDAEFGDIPIMKAIETLKTMWAAAEALAIASRITHSALSPIGGVEKLGG